MQKKQVLSYLSAQKRAFKARRALQIKFFLCLMLLVASISTFAAVTSPEDSKVSTEIVVGTTMASMMAIGMMNLNETAARHGFWLVETTQLDSARPFPIPTANREVS